MKRLHIKHCRDSAVNPGMRWDLWATDTHDPHAEPLWLAFGSWHAMRRIAAVLLVLNTDYDDFVFGGFQVLKDASLAWG